MRGYTAKINANGSFDPRKTGGLYVSRSDGYNDGVAISESAVKPDEWFVMDVVVNDNHVVTKVNGNTISDFLDSKRSFSSGFLALQCYRGATQVEFRSIEVKELASGARAEIAVSDWVGAADCWKVTPQEIVGDAKSPTIHLPTYLCSTKTYRDFELSGQVWLVLGDSGIQFRSDYLDRGKFRLRGPQLDLGPSGWGSLFGQDSGGVLASVPNDIVQRIVKPGEYNEVFLRCEGKHVTIKINGHTTVDRDFTTLADKGLIGFQLFTRDSQVIFRDLRLTELGK